VIVDDLNVCRVRSTPYKTDAPLIVDPNTMLALPVAFQAFKPIGRRDPEVVKGPGVI